MDSVFLILLTLVDGPLNAEEIIKNMVRNMGKQSPYHHINSNDFLCDLNALYKASGLISMKDGVISITEEGRETLSKNKIFHFIHDQMEKL